MVSSFGKVCVFIAYCGVLIINGVESNGNPDNQEVLFCPPNSDCQLTPYKYNELPEGWKSWFDINNMPSNPENINSRTTRNDGRRKSSRSASYPRSSEMNLPLYYYY